MRTTQRLALAVACAVCLTLLLGTVWVAAAPPVPATFYGTVLVNGSNPTLPVTVEALIGGQVYRAVQGASSGPNVVYSLDVPGDVPETPGTKEGGVAGETVQFRVAGLVCAQTSTWQSGARANLNLAATGTLPTLTPTQTPTNTPIASLTPTRTNTPSATTTPVTIDLKVSNTSIHDTFINFWSPDQVQQAPRTRLYVRQGIYRSLLWFDIAAHLPTDANVQSATLNLYLSSYEHLMLQSPLVSVYKVKQSWDDLQATWNQRLTGLAWSGPGCDNSADRDLLEVPGSGTTVTNVSAWYQFNITSLTQDWAWGTPSENNGMILISDNPRELRFYAADDTDVRYQPYIRVTYTRGGSGPEPSQTPANSPTPTKTPSITATPQRFERLGALSDTFVSSWEPDLGHGNVQLRVRGSGSMRSLLQFDVSAIPLGSTIVSGTLRLTTYEYDDAKLNLSLNIGAYLANKAWSESEATWNLASTGIPWTVAGCSGVPQDRLGTPSGTTAARLISGPTGPGVSYVWDVTSIAHAWVNSPGTPAGLVLMAEDANQREIRFIHSEESRTDRWPLLVLYWLPPSPTITPTATPTNAPTQTTTPTPTQTLAGGTVTGVIYNDNALGVANGQRDPGESGLPGALVQLWSGVTFVGEYTTTGSGAFTFSNVPAGAHTLITTAPSGYLASPGSPSRRDIAVVLGYTTEVSFGVYDPLLVTPLGGIAIPLVMKGH